MLNVGGKFSAHVNLSLSESVELGNTKIPKNEWRCIRSEEVIISTFDIFGIVQYVEGQAKN